MSRTTTRDAATEFDAWMAEQKRRAAQTFAAGALVRLHDDVGTKTQQAVTFRVDRLPDPRAKRKADRMYGLVPVTGGHGLSAEASMLRPANEREVKAAQATATTERFVVGEVVVPSGVRLRGADPVTELVVIDVTLKGLKLAPLYGSPNGSYWTNVPFSGVTKVTR